MSDQALDKVIDTIERLAKAQVEQRAQIVALRAEIAAVREQLGIGRNLDGLARRLDALEAGDGKDDARPAPPPPLRLASP
jgi:hypothetical protein